MVICALLRCGLVDALIVLGIDPRGDVTCSRSKVSRFQYRFRKPQGKGTVLQGYTDVTDKDDTFVVSFTDPQLDEPEEGIGINYLDVMRILLQ